MARYFNGSTDYYSLTHSPLTNEPFTIGCWFKVDALNVNYTLISLGNNGASGYWRIYAAGSDQSNSLAGQKQNDSGSSLTVITTVDYTAGNWHHAAMIGESDTRFQIYLDGTPGGETTTSLSDPTPDFVTIGALRRNAVIQYLAGSVAEVGIWNSVLTNTDIRKLAQGYSPSMISPESLAVYVPLVREPYDQSGIAFPAFGTPVPSIHPRIIRPSRRPYLKGTITASPPPPPASPIVGRYSNLTMLGVT